MLNALAGRTGIDPADVDDVIIGNGNPAGDHGDCIGRMAVLAAGWPVEAPGITLNRFCGSGQQAITFAAMGIQAGHQELVVGGGVESMSRWPSPTARPTSRRATPHLREMFPLVPQGISADLIATIEGFTREDVDTLRRREPGPRRQGDRRRSLRPQRRARSPTPTAASRSTSTSIPRPGSTLEGWPG